MGLTNTREGGAWKPTTTLRAKDAMILALLFGVATGLIEGGLLYIFKDLYWHHWTKQAWSVVFEMIWISIALDLSLFLVLGLFVVLLGRLHPRLGQLRWTIFFFVLMAFFDWLDISGHIRGYAALVLAAGLASVAMRWFSRHPLSAMQLARRSFPWVVTLTLLAFTGTEGGVWLKERIATANLPPLPSASPNILVVVVDTLRADHLSAYGYARATSPNVDGIARQGVLFENAFAASSWTLPSHASLLTGRYPHEHGANVDFYDGRYPTLAQALCARGYRTGAFSANTYNFARVRGFGPGFLHFEDYFGSLADMGKRTFFGRKFDEFIVFPLGYRDTPGRKRASEVNREFFRWVGHGQGKRFFSFLNYNDVHIPYRPPEPYRTRFATSKTPGAVINQAFPSQAIHDLRPEQLQGEMDAYDGGVAYVDAEIAQLFAGLKTRGLSENTIVVITSDHGEEFGEHGLQGHGNSLYRQETHVPLILWWPGKIPVGLRLGMPVTNAAVAATILDLLGNNEQNPFPGPSLAQLWKTPAALSAWPEPFAELEEVSWPLAGKFWTLRHGPPLKSLITSRWQYITNDKLGEELYDWKQDPQELHDLASTSEGQRVDQDFLAHLRTLLGEAFGKREVDKQKQTQETAPASSRLR